ncbi:MAG: type VI secretion system protein TssA [Gammaproteobacteria bacterium]|nr:type VI secretion system protein TssA [Gammaproteobacteria bacterium]MCP5425492.1 type VI secretion system protein TssA [Gammaproteobacteria bacterium]MCP5459388.1 type VI secretion system protein TssA [Gammaproteobacteria bacterium]
MAVIDLEKLLQPVSEESPCGEDLEYDPAFQELETAIQGKPEQQFGATIIPAEEPDWRDIQKKTLPLLGRSKDMRLAVYLVRALLGTQGFAGFNEGLELLQGWLQNYWEGLHPLLDPDDNNDPTMRANILGSLCDWDTALRRIRETPLVSVRTFGRISLRDIDIASGTQPAPTGSDEPVPEMGAIDGAFMECDGEELKAVALAVRSALGHVQAIDAYFTDQVGAAQAPDMGELIRALKEVQQVLMERLSRRGLSLDSSVGEDEALVEEGMPGEVAAQAQGGVVMAPVRVGEITTREDVVRMLDKICDYYAKYEPSSPVPLLLQRAKRLASKHFLEILRDLAPDAVAQAEMLRGPDGE